MAEDREDLLRYYRTTRADLLAATDGLSDIELSEPSLDGWSVANHFAHLAVWDDIRASEVQRISAGHESAWRMTGEQDNQFNVMSHDLRRNLSLGQAKWELFASRERLLNAISSANARALDPSLYGEAGLRTGHEAEHTGWIRQWRKAKGL
jgi:hypothetical protein